MEKTDKTKGRKFESSNKPLKLKMGKGISNTYN